MPFLSLAYHPLHSISHTEIFSRFSFLEKTNFSYESLVARYYLLASLQEKFGISPLLEKETTGKPKPFLIENEMYYYSISHTKDMVLVAYADFEIGIDIEHIGERDPSVFSLHSDREYELLGGKNLENFYRLWTMKESLLKVIGIELDHISEMYLISFLGVESGKSLSREIGADTIGIIVFQNRQYRVACKKLESHMIAWTLPL